MHSLSSYDYILPEQLIAQLPTEKREESRLLLLDKQGGNIQDESFGNICNYLTKGDVLVLNDAKVIPARVFGYKDTGAKLELLLLKKLDPYTWEVLLKPAKRMRVGDALRFENGLEGVLLEKREAIRIVRFNKEFGDSQVLKDIGHMPLPPYIKYDENLKQYYQERYQTVFAQKLGAVAAPTAGLHFSLELLEKIKAMGVTLVNLTLYVGLGTFKPVEQEDITTHQMHSESYEISKEAVAEINRAKTEGRRVIATGTTVVRVLESVFARHGKLQEEQGETNIFIFPGFKFSVVDALITNFHLPKSTLLMLVSAFAGKENIRKAYEYAVLHNYRFFSFGDAMFIL